VLVVVVVVVLVLVLAAAADDDNDDDDDDGDDDDDDIGGMAMAGFIAGVGYVDCDHILAVTLLTIGWAFSGLIGVGPHVSALDMSPQHAGSHFLSTSTITV